MRDRFRPYVGARERLRPSELVEVIGHRGASAEILDALLPDRPWYLTTYGKTAFELAVMDAGLSGSTILVPGYISHDYVGVFRRHDVTPRFADVDPATVQLDPLACTDELLAGVSAILLLHTFGLPADGARFKSIADEHGVVLIEDCARALGGERDGHPVGWYGDYAAYSLSKVAPVMRGGVLSSRRPVEAALPDAHLSVPQYLNALMLLRLPGMRLIERGLVRRLRDSAVYQTEVGLYEAPPIEALDRAARIVLDAYLPHYGAAVAVKRRHAARLRAELEPLGFEFQADTGGHLYTALGARVPEGVPRDGLVAHLAEQGINAFTLWGDPLGTSSVAQRLWGTDAAALPVTARLASEYVHFPINRFLTPDDLRRIVTACTEFVSHPMRDGGRGLGSSRET